MGNGNRALILSAAILVGLALVVLRLADLMLLNHDRLAEKARSQQLSKKELTVNRGHIYDRRGRELAVNVDAISVYCRPEAVENEEAASRALATVTGRTSAEMLAELRRHEGFFWAARKVDYELGAPLRSRKNAVKGVEAVQEVRRFYPKGPLAAHVLGFVGIDNQALEGVELVWDSTLKGREQKVLVTRDASGKLLTGGFEIEGGGQSVVLTLDEGLQYIVEKELAASVKTWRASAATAIMMDPYTGEVLALANYPHYDPNRPGSASLDARRNRSITDPYEPGSTFKIVAAAAALQEGVVKLESKIDTGKGYITVAGRRIYDTHKERGPITFAEVIKTSSNVGTIMVTRRMDSKVLHRYVEAFGFGKKTGIDLPGEAAGQIRPIKNWSETSKAAVSIGYEVAVTPLQVLRAYSAVANGGYLVKPHLVGEVLDAGGQQIYRFPVEDNRQRVIDEDTAKQLREALIGVTQEGGTAMSASINGDTVAGKTGTTRLLDSGGQYSTKRYASSFVGFVPARNPMVSLIVVVFEPEGEYYGGHVAAPAFRAMADQTLAYLGVPREDLYDKNVLMVENRVAPALGADSNISQGGTR